MKIGDRVRVIGTDRPFANDEGNITRKSPCFCHDWLVKLDNATFEILFTESELEVI